MRIDKTEVDSKTFEICFRMFLEKHQNIVKF